MVAGHNESSSRRSSALTSRRRLSGRYGWRCHTKQVAAPVEVALPKFEAYGSLVSGTEESRGVISLDRPNRQWDYPYAPADEHQGH